MYKMYTCPDCGKVFSQDEEIAIGIIAGAYAVHQVSEFVDVLSSLVW